MLGRNGNKRIHMATRCDGRWHDEHRENPVTVMPRFGNHVTLDALLGGMGEAIIYCAAHCDVGDAARRVLFD
jgi:hypothetical protein